MISWLGIKALVTMEDWLAGSSCTCQKTRKGGNTMSYKVFVGIDVSKDSFSACALKKDLQPLFEASFPMDIKGFRKLRAMLSRLSKDSILIAKESSGCYHFNLFAFLSKSGYNCVILNPLLVSRFATLNLRKTKTDRIDARTIATMLSIFHEKLPKSSFLSQEFKELAREREKIAQQIARVKNDIEKLSSTTFPELQRKTAIYTDSILRLLQRFPSAQTIKRAPIEEIEKIVRPKGRGRKTSLSAEEIKTLAKHSIAQFFPARETILMARVRELFFLKERLAETTAMLKTIGEECADPQDIRLLKSIKGIGEVTALHLLAEMDGVERFGSHKKLIAYAGLDPTVYRSGRFEGKSRISKRGNRHLRRVIWLMGVAVARFNPYFRNYFLKKREKGLPYKKAILACTHKLLRVIYAMLTRKIPFSAHYPVSPPLELVNSL